MISVGKVWRKGALVRHRWACRGREPGACCGTQWRIRGRSRFAPLIRWVLPATEMGRLLGAVPRLNWYIILPQGGPQLTCSPLAVTGDGAFAPRLAHTQPSARGGRGPCKPTQPCLPPTATRNVGGRRSLPRGGLLLSRCLFSSRSPTGPR